MDEASGDLLAHILIANEGEVITRLRLSAAEAARVCNVTPRQLIYWTKKGLVRSASGEDYDIFAIERAIRIRKALERGNSLEKAGQLVEQELERAKEELARLESMGADALESELRRRLEQLEEAVVTLRQTLPAGLALARLRRAVALLGALEQQGVLGAKQGSSDGAMSLVLRLGRAIEELEQLLREVHPVRA